MTEPTTIEEFAEHYSCEIGVVLLAIVKYLVDDPRTISPQVRRVLLTATNQEIEEALETIAEDLKLTGSKETLQ